MTTPNVTEITSRRTGIIGSSYAPTVVLNTVRRPVQVTK